MVLALTSATPGLAETSLLRTFLSNCGEAYFSGYRPSLSGLEPSELQDLEGYTLFDLENGYAVFVSNPESSVSSCGLNLRFASRFEGSVQDEVDEVLQWIADRKAEGILSFIKSVEQDGVNATYFMYRTPDNQIHCPVLFFGHRIDQSQPELGLVVATYDVTVCRGYLGS